ncbi:MAG TPA: HEAT repeat domain-containing protein [Polyangiaceae bacterium]
MARFWSIALTATVLLVSCAAPAHNLQSSIGKLRSNEDFRVRVQAALELGKSSDPAVRVPLEQALRDRKAAVRAAAAAALKAHGDKRAVAALKARLGDPSPSVRAQLKSSIQALEGAGATRSDPARLLVKLGSIKNGTQVKSGTLVGQLAQASREKFGRMPGVQVVEDSEDVNRAAKKQKLPAVMVTGRLRRLNASREGGDIVYSAMVDYVIHSMPEQSILSVMTGSASAKASPVEARDRHRMAELRALVLERAIESAMRGAPEAFAAAMK